MATRGRRSAGSPDARSEILVSARQAFARDGYNTSLRGIAREAGVDPALVHHYFPDRAGLFVAAVTLGEDGAALDPSEILEQLRQVPAERVGEGIVRAFLGTWSGIGVDRFKAIFRAVVAEDSAVDGLRHFLMGELVAPLVARISPDHVGLRSDLVVSQILGIGMSLWVIGLDRLVSLSDDERVAVFAPTIQRCLTGEFSDLPADTLVL